MFLYETLTIDKLYFYPSLENTVCAIQYTYTFDNLVDSEAKVTKLVRLPLPQANFVPYDNLTEEMVKQWVNQYDSETIDYFRRKCVAELIDQNNPQVTPSSLPWDN